MQTSPEKRNPSGSREYSGTTKFKAFLAAVALGLGGCSAAQGSGEQISQAPTATSTEAPTPAPAMSETPTPAATPEATASATPEEYTMPEYAKPAKDMVKDFYDNYSLDDISNMRPLGLWLIDSEDIITEAAQLLGTIHINALEAYEQSYLGTGLEFNTDNPLFNDIHKMSPEDLARALNGTLYYAMQTTPGDFTPSGSIHKAALDINKAKKLACLHMCSGSSNQWVRFRDFLDGYSPHKNIKKPATTESYIDIRDDVQATASITQSQMVEVGDLGEVELVTIQRKGDNLQPEREWEEKWLFVPYSALPELPGINGESFNRMAEVGDPVDFNRPRPDGNGGYVTLDGTPAVVPVLLN
ncbi:MAG: hypothetical protein Q4A34_02665 [Candidatus Saccharibacteria bacterium]|nr:hypothetical protein [Candidatus Saccharibacteria bacterium]